MKFFVHDLKIFISKEKCRIISRSEMCVVKYYSICSDNQVSFIRSYPANIRLDDEDVLKTSFVFVFRRRLEDVFKTSWSRPIYSSWLYVFKTSSRRLAKTSSRHLQVVLQGCLQDVLKTYYQVKLFA